MALQKTLAIVKPDAVGKNLIGEIIHRLETAGFGIIRLKMEQLTEDDARRFYRIHENQPFFGDLVKFMTSGPCVPIALEKENAIEDLRVLIGVTDSRKAACGTVRQNFGTDIRMNAIHASDSEENAGREISFFFPDIDP